MYVNCARGGGEPGNEASKLGPIMFNDYLYQFLQMFLGQAVGHTVMSTLALIKQTNIETMRSHNQQFL